MLGIFTSWLKISNYTGIADESMIHIFIGLQLMIIFTVAQHKETQSSAPGQSHVSCTNAHMPVSKTFSLSSRAGIWPDCIT